MVKNMKKQSWPVPVGLFAGTERKSGTCRESNQSSGQVVVPQIYSTGRQLPAGSSCKALAVVLTSVLSGDCALSDISLPGMMPVAGERPGHVAV